ncbi:MAG TPA: 2,4'-dihydroxyacetophenone dioxygenase family protein [Aliidongia sp.]|nr:2,4'-dihydroxyacetophenone dioxygenase family protein [Aliidongia sp.]
MLYEQIATTCIADEALPWLPFGPGRLAQIKYFKCDPIRGEVISILKAPSAAQLPRHHHSGTVIVYTIKGQWKYQEHDWIAGPGSLVFETAASRHTPEGVPAGGPEIVTLNIVQGDLAYLDADDKVVAIENWRTAMEHYLKFCRSNGIEPLDLTHFQ